jgi:ubiquinone/menaquinone biosynthesis C-methylase UbiE
VSADGSFGAGYADIDGDGAQELLDYLDELAAIPAVRDAKRAAIAALTLRAGERVLDVGCGTGVDLLELAQRVRPGGTVVGLDPSRRALEAAGERVAGQRDIELLRANVETIPFGESTVDACAADRTLQHVAEPEQALAELRRVLRPEGRLVVSEMRSQFAADLDTEVARAAAQHLWPASGEAWLPYMLPLLLRRAGFREVDVIVSEATSSSLEEARRALRLSDWLELPVEDRGFGASRVREWLEDLHNAARRGEALLQMRFVSIRAIAA